MTRFKTAWVTSLTALSVILVEILYTRLFSAIYFSSFAFLIISLALFGTGLSGIMFSLTRGKTKVGIGRYILLLAVSLPIVLKLTMTVKIDFLNLFNNPVNFLYLILNFFVLIIPFFFGGMVLVKIFSEYSSKINRLYFYDLAGAAIGSILIIPFISIAGPARATIILSVMLTLTWFFVSDLKKYIRSIIGAIIISLLIISMWFSGNIFKLIPKIEKRDYISDLRKGRIEHSVWSPINKIDVAPFVLSKGKKVVWLNCGTQQTWFVKTPEEEVGKKELKWTHAAIPYQLAKKGSALIIGSAGGYEVLCALSNGFKRIFAVEMDPQLCKLVKGKYSEYIGNIFHRRGVFLINDEGRSVLRRLNKKYDVIQMVNSHPKDTLLSGGLSISETYIYSVSAFKEYWKYLAEDGFLSIVHVYGERMFSTAFQALREMKIKNPEKKFFIIQIPNGFNYFFLKKGDLNPEDLKILNRFAGENNIVFSPFVKNDNIYFKLTTPDYEKTVKGSSVNIFPVRDNSPYFNQPNKIGQFNFQNNFIMGMAREKVERVKRYTNSVYLSILLISLLFSILFIYIPLRIKGGKGESGTILFFSMIGLGFIIVEIILIKIFQLLLGNPSYSISMIIFSLLISAGVGSFFSDYIFSLFGKKMIYISIFIAIILTLYSQLLFPVIYATISFPLIYRAGITLLLIMIPGIPMGVFFPLGIRSVEGRSNSLIGWAWGANAFATVLGSVITVIISINWNFSVGLIMAALIYLMAGKIFEKKY